MNLINMDGLEWQRAKWSLPACAWLYLNERLACRLGNHLIADHPEIANHLATRAREKITMIPYGSDTVKTADPGILDQFDLQPGGYLCCWSRGPSPKTRCWKWCGRFQRNLAACGWWCWVATKPRKATTSARCWPPPVMKSSSPADLRSDASRRIALFRPLVSARTYGRRDESSVGRSAGHRVCRAGP